MNIFFDSFYFLTIVGKKIGKRRNRIGNGHIKDDHYCQIQLVVNYLELGGHCLEIVRQLMSNEFVGSSSNNWIFKNKRINSNFRILQMRD